VGPIVVLEEEKNSQPLPRMEPSKNAIKQIRKDNNNCENTETLLIN